MKIFIGSDHGGMRQKSLVIPHLEGLGHEVVDCGSYTTQSSDYSDFASAVAKSVTEDTNQEKGLYYPTTDRLGILFCRSGEGMEMAANKCPGIRAALVWSDAVAAETRNDNDANVIVIPADFLSDEVMLTCIDTFISTPFSQIERHRNRLVKLHALENLSYGQL
jgi:ribose 5-phosphate isomerase B